MTTHPLWLLPVLFVCGVACSGADDDTSNPGGSSGSSSTAGTTFAGTAGLPATSGSSGATTSAGSSTGGAGAATGGTASGGGNAAGSAAGGSTGIGGTASGGTASGGTTSGGTAGSGTGGAQGGSGGMTALDGKGLYDANCKACHGEQGAGGPLGPDIMHPVRDYSTWVVRNGRAQTTFAQPMAKFGTDKISDAQLKLIFDYLDMPPQPTTGQALFNDYCANCHGADGKGGPTMRNITNEVSKVLTLVRSGKNVGNFAMRRDYMPAFPTSDISDSELALIRDYVDSL